MLYPRDDPSTYNIAVLLVHESELAKQRRHLEMEQQLIADLETQLKTTHSPVAEAELIMHEVWLMIDDDDDDDDWREREGIME